MAVVLTSLSLTGCRGNKGDTGEQINSVYYWRTTFSLSTDERQFIRDNNIRRMYVRYFDVAPQTDGTLMPNATIAFDGAKMPEGVQIVPVVYILNDCMKYDVTSLGGKIVDRIIQMNETNNIHDVREIQIDCDWTVRSRRVYFALLQDIRKCAAKHHIRLSATVRLHQLTQTPPPVDYGTLMVYNTGDVKDIGCNNPILQLKDVAPYLKYLTDYPLKLNAAYPIFRWTLLYRNRHFVGFLHGNDIEIYPGDSVIERQCGVDEIMKVKEAISEEREDINSSVTIYALDKKNIIKYKKNDIKKIYNR